ncbi:MAG TPA: acetoacetate--CoA ligase [Steroidobacteraceae bacterium]
MMPGDTARDPRTLKAGDILWTPSAERAANANVSIFMRWLERERGLRFDDYAALWRWSVQDLEAFWQALWDYFRIEASAAPTRVLGSRRMPGAEWFPGARLNYARHVLRGEQAGREALLFTSETRPLTAMSSQSLAAQVRVLATQLRELGIQPGDRVAAVLPNIPETVVAMLASTAIGAVWAICSPDFGVRGAVDRLAPLRPKLLICVDGYRYGGKAFDRRAEMSAIADALPDLKHVIAVPYLNPDEPLRIGRAPLQWGELLSRAPVSGADFHYEEVPFDHPLWILFSSGTTGLPKAIVHGHGGILLETMKNGTFHFDLHAGQRLLFFTTSGWMLWNFIAGTPAIGGVPVLYDGHPGYPQPDALWKLADEAQVALFGASPAYVEQMARTGIVPRERYELSRLQSIVLAGSPASPECMQWFHLNVKRDLWVANGSGGTDCCTGFVGGVPTLPVGAGQIQAPSLGVAVKAFDERGNSVTDQVGELVLTEPMPSMPLRFWNDESGQRYRETYFEDYPGVWRHGDLFRIGAGGESTVVGRSDATLNRYGIRIGTAEIYRSLARLEEVEDALIVNLDLPGGRFFMPLFVKLAPGLVLDAALASRIRATLREDYTARHVPDAIYQVPAIPTTRSGKKMEVPIRRLLMGMDPEKAANRSAMSDPAALDFYIDYVRRQRDYSMQA